MLQAIDCHAHYGTFKADTAKWRRQFYSGGLDVVLERARKADTSLSLVSPLEALTPRHQADPVAGNRHAAEEITATKGILQYVVVDPLKPDTFNQAREMLAQPQCVGIKIHPEEHGYPIAEHGEAIFKFAAERRAIVQTHSGEQNSLPEDFVSFADRFPEVILIVSHLGCGWDDDPTHQVRAIQNARNGNIYTDTSSAMSITSGLIEWAVKEVGADRILYGTDSPLYFAPMQRARIDNADISDDDKRLILRKSAEALFDLTEILKGLES